MILRYALLTSLSFVIAHHALAQGDHCEDAWLIDPGPQVADGPFTGEGATHDDALNADWYAFDPPTAGYITVSSCGGPRDTRVHIHTGSCGALTELGTDDDGCPDGYPPGNSLLANIPVTPGNLYFIEWDDRYSMQGFNWELMYHTCPIAIPAFTLGDNTVDIVWDAVVPGAQFTVEYGPEGFIPGTGQVITGVEGTDGPPVHLADLLSATTYDVYLRVDCGAEGEAPFEGPWHPRTTGSLPNEDCGGALPITCGALVEGSTAEAQNDEVPDCGTGIQAPGIWYTFTGAGGYAVLTTCGNNDYDTRLNVYSGPCDDLTCVGGNDDGQFCGFGSEVTVAAGTGTVYHVLVQGYDGATGAFGLTLECPTCPAPANIGVTPGDQQALVQWTSYNPGAFFQVEYGPDGFEPGTGQTVTGSVGVNGPPVFIEGLEPSTAYDVYVTEDCGAGGVSTMRGPVDLETVAGPLPPNAFCGGAVPIGCGQDVSGDTQEGFLAINAACGGSEVTSKGLWYGFTGQGVEVTLSTCGQSAFDTRISVFSGDCASLQCVLMNDDGAGCAGNSSELSFLAVEGVDYLVLVHGYEDNAGTFTLTMGCAEPCDPAVANDDCANAITITPQSLEACTPLEGTNQCAYDGAAPTPPCDPFASIHDVWYHFNAGPSTAHQLTVATLNAVDLKAAIYTGCASYENIACFETVGPTFMLQDLQEGADYYVRLWTNSAEDAGTFTICDQAEFLTGITEASRDAAGAAWPVPAHDRIQFSGMPTDARVLEVLDAQGRLVRTESLNGATTGSVDVSGLAPGAYVLKASAQRPWTARVLVD